MDNDELYELLRTFTSPVVAITSRRAEETNGMIANSAIRASLVPECPRLAFYCFKAHYSHELISETGRFCLHLLHRDQMDVVRELGFESGRNADKLASVDHSVSDKGLPVIENSFAHFECTVINAMDAGPSTFFLGDVTDTGRSPEDGAKTPLTGEYLRDNLPEDLRRKYRRNKQQFQDWARERLDVDPTYTWEQ